MIERRRFEKNQSWQSLASQVGAFLFSSEDSQAALELEGPLGRLVRIGVPKARMDLLLVMFPTPPFAKS